MYTYFTPIEIKNLISFIANHKHIKDASSDVVIRVDASSGIGQNMYVKCMCDKKEEDITDYGSW